MKKTKLTRNFTLKIMSVFIGFLIWFIVVNVDNPVSSKSITIAGENVELQNTAYVDSANMMCMQDDEALIQIRLWFQSLPPVQESAPRILK